MKRSLFCIPVLLVLACSLAVLAGDHDVLFLSEGEAEAFDLSELSDGETRHFGSGERQLTAVREGDTVSLKRGATGDAKALSVSCKLGTDVCTVITHGDADERVMVKIERKVECAHGSDDCMQDVEVVALGKGHHDGANVWVRKLADCEGDDKDCMHREISVTVDQMADAKGNMVFIGEDGTHPNVIRLDEHANVMHFGEDGKVLLSCPEGDSKIHVEKEEAEDTFLCPKHNVPMEKVEMANIHKILIERTVVEDED